MKWTLANISKLYDGSAAAETAVRERVDLTVADERIVSVEPHDARILPAPVKAGETVIDASAYTVTPGLVDCHGHVTALGIDHASIDVMNTDAALVYVEKILYATLVEGGVTTMRDIGGATARVKRLVDEGVLIGPRLKVAICMLSTTGGHADFRGPDRCHAEISRLWPPAPGRPSSIVDGPWECRKRVREIAACGADLVKVCASPGVASPSDHLDHREFNVEELTAICDEAAHRGLQVASHAHSASGIDLAIQCGVHDIQHMSYMTDQQVERAGEQGCVVTPTSWIMSALLEAEGLSPFVMEKVKQVNEVHSRAVQYAVEGGLPILMGTDPVLPGMHGRNWMELVHLVRDGLSNLATWHGSTGLAAREIGATNTGELVAGKRADLLVCTQDVVQDPGRFEHGALFEVVKDGVGYRGQLEGLPQESFATTVSQVLGRR